jgi:Bacterial regulatory proteins, luxR family
MQGVSTRQMAHALALSPHTVQDHLKSIFAKTGVRSRSELVGQIFLEHYVPRWEDIGDVPTGWLGKASPVPVGIDPGPSPDAATLASPPPAAIHAAANAARDES